MPLLKIYMFLSVANRIQQAEAVSDWLIFYVGVLQLLIGWSWQFQPCLGQI